MATRKKTKKASLKKNRLSGKLAGTNQIFEVGEIVYENSDDPYGTIESVDDELGIDERMEKYLSEHSGDKDFRPECYDAVIEKFETAKDKKKLRFSDFELRVLEKALDNSLSYFAMKPEFNELKWKLALANTSMKNCSNSYEKNLREVGRILGFTKGAKKIQLTSAFSIPPKGKKRFYDPEAVTSYYKKLISSEWEREEAVKECAKKFSFPNNDACSRYLRKYRRKLGLKNIPSFRSPR
jgi:hypothetical protein